MAAAAVVTWRLWADPASHVAAGNVPDADAFAWFLRYDATAVAHGRLPALITSALNAPQGVNVMWNNFMLLPGVLLAPVTLEFGPQVSLTLMTTLGFAGSACALFYVLRRWGVGTGAAGLAGAVYGFSPALLQSALGHYNLQFAVLPPLIADRVLRLAIRHGGGWLRDSVWLGVLCAAQIFIAEEVLAETALAVVLLLTVLAAGAPRLARARIPGVLRGLGVAGGCALVLAGYPLWVQFFGPLTAHGSRFPLGTFQNDISGFVTPSQHLLFHTAGSATAAARFPYGAPEYLAYLGWPLLAALIALALACRRHVMVAACAIVLVILELLSLGAQKLIIGTAMVSLPWSWLSHAPLVGLGLPDRLSILADGFAAAMIGLGLDVLLRKSRGSGQRRSAAALWSIAVAAVLPLTPLPLQSASASTLPAGWQTVFAALRLPPGAFVLTVPVPAGEDPLTPPMRWQANTGSPDSLIGGYFQGPDNRGHAALDGTGLRPTAFYLDRLWLGDPPSSAPTRAQAEDDLSYWRPAAVVAVTQRGSPVDRYLTELLGPPSVEAGEVIAWRLLGTHSGVAVPRPGPGGGV